jgi:hypothetical protein
VVNRPEATQQECIVFMPMLAGYERIRDTVKCAIERSGLAMRRLEVALTDAEWQWWLIANLPSASFAVVDVTDHNPFVMYELGLAHNRLLPALLIVDSRNERVPATVLGSPFLPYDGLAPHTCLDALAAWIADAAAACRALPLAAVGSGDGCRHDVAVDLLQQFRHQSAMTVEAVSRDEFTTRMRVAEGRGELPAPDGDGRRLALRLLPRIIRHSDDVQVMSAVWQWTGVCGLPAAAVNGQGLPSW